MPEDNMAGSIMGAPTLLLSGLDSLYAGFFIDGIGIDWGALEDAKQFAQAERDRSHEFELGGFEFVVEPRGAHPYRYVLRNERFLIRLGEHISPRCHVQYLSKGLWDVGWRGLTDRLTDWFERIGCYQIQPATVSRADFAFDFALGVIDFGKDDFVTRAAKVAAWWDHGSIQSFQIGRGDTLIRVYDKVAEIEQQSQKAYFFDLWGQKEDVWRVEAQVRRERLKQAGMGLLRDLGDLQADLLREVFTKNTRLCRNNGDANRSRWPNHPLWEALLAAIAAQPQLGLIEALDPATPITYARAKLVQSIYGHLKGFAACHGLLWGDGSPPTLGVAINAFVRDCVLTHSADSWADDVADRMTKRRLGQ